MIPQSSSSSLASSSSSSASPMIATASRRHNRNDDSPMAILNPDEEDECQCRGFRYSLFKTVLTHFVSLLLLGLPYLIGRWKPNWKLRWTSSPCLLRLADAVILDDGSGESSVEQISRVLIPADFPKRYAVKRQIGGGAVDEATDSTRLLAPFALYHLYFYSRNAKYVWDNSQNTFVRLRSLDRGQSLSSFYTDFQGYTAEQQRTNAILHGPNSIDVEVKPYLKLLVDEVLNPFYIFQIGSIILWSFDEYYYYASCIFFISITSIVVSLCETRRQSQSLHDMVAQSSNLTVTVCRGGLGLGGQGPTFEDVSSISLVPGDVISIPSRDCIMPCDAVLISGTCIVNESSLTGESVPVTKSALPHAEEVGEEEYSPEVHNRHMLFAGTKVIQTRYYGNSHVLAVVVNTGFSTSKGELVRSILYPKAIGFKFYKDSIFFIIILFGIASVGMVYCVAVFVHQGAPLATIIIRCLDLVTIAVPPALPAAMTIGTYYTQNRLKKSKIYCISPQRINVCGKLKLVRFDKTGTLTEDGLDMWGVIAARDGNFGEVTKDVPALEERSPVLNCLAACHSLTLIDDKLTGDPLDIKMFEATGWSLEEAGEQDTVKYDMLMPTVVRPRHEQQAGMQQECNVASELDNLPYEIGIIRQFTFSSSKARMSVITRTLGGRNFEVFTKGAPEKLEELCRPHTLPTDFHEKLREFTLQGYRVIALAHRMLPREMNWVRVQKIKRPDVEMDLSFLGFLVMQNTLKPESTPVINQLTQAGIRCVMVTGDNLLTAISVARDCKMILQSQRVIVVEASAPSVGGSANANITYFETDKSDRGDLLPYPEDAYDNRSRESCCINGLGLVQGDYHLALSGKTWAAIRSHYPQLLQRIAVKGTVFARMGPEQKAQLVEELQAVDYVVGMCGDGANDCGALKAAHVGISLSQAEASVAAPFTSHIPNITCVPTVVREGRCSLITSFCVFKYMALYSMIQFISVEILYTLKTNLTDKQFLYIDLVITTTVAVLMGWTEAYPKLVSKRPSGSLVSSTNLFSIISQVVVVFAIQLGALLYLMSMPWYVGTGLVWEHGSTNNEAFVNQSDETNKSFANLPHDDDETFANEPHQSNPNSVLWESTTIFVVSSFQYLILAAAYSKGPPFRKPFYTNIPFFLALLLLTVFTMVLALYPGSALAGFFSLAENELYPLGRWHFRLVLLLFVLVNVVLAIAIEYLVHNSKALKALMHFLAKKRGPKNKFKKLLIEMEREDWPPAQQMDGSDGQSQKDLTIRDLGAR